MRRVLAALTVLLCAAAAHGAVKGCNTASCEVRAKRACLSNHDCRLRVVRAYKHKVADPYWGIFMAIYSCERGADGWQTNTGNGFFGGLQFTLTSWHGVGGRGYPHHASKLEQIYRGVLLMREQGWNAWPTCRHTAGV